MKTKDDIKIKSYLYRLTGDNAIQSIMHDFQPLENAARLIGYGNLEQQLHNLKHKCIDAVVNSYKLLLYNIDISTVNKPLANKIKEKYSYEIN